MTSENPLLNQTMDDLLTSIEELHSAGKFNGSAERYFAIIERCSEQRPVSYQRFSLIFWGFAPPVVDISEEGLEYETY